MFLSFQSTSPWPVCVPGPVWDFTNSPLQHNYCFLGISVDQITPVKIHHKCCSFKQIASICLCLSAQWFERLRSVPRGSASIFAVQKRAVFIVCRSHLGGSLRGAHRHETGQLCLSVGETLQMVREMENKLLHGCWNIEEGRGVCCWTGASHMVYVCVCVHVYVCVWQE